MPDASVAGIGIGAVSSLFGADRAADAAGDAAASSNALQRYIYDQTRADQAPYRSVGEGALMQLAGLYGIDSAQYGYDPAARYDPSQEYSAARDQAIEAEVRRRAVASVPGGQRNMLAINRLQNGSINDFDQALIDQVTRDIDADPSAFGLTPASARSQQSGFPAGKDGTPLRLDPITDTTGPTTQAGGQGSDPYAAFRASPDYQFALQEGQNALARSLNASGMSLSGRGIQETQRFGQGLASQQFNNYANRLASIAGIGQTANNALQSAGQNYAANAGNAIMQAGDARASGYLTSANAINQGLNSWLNYNALQNYGGG